MPSPLATPVELPCGAVLPNRLVKAAMTEGLADAGDQPGRRLETLYATWSNGGAGLLVSGNVMVDRRYLERPGNVVVDEATDRDRLAAFAAAGTRHGKHFWMQISHPGRQCTRMSSSSPLSASNVGLKMGGMFARPRAMTPSEIDSAVHRFAFVARAAKKAGFTGVQVHGAHGYLVSQFLSPLTNRRDDAYGGALENRARFLLEIVRAVRDATGPDFPVGVKLNSADFQVGGFRLDEAVTVTGWLGEAGVDLLEISGGTYEQPVFLQHADERPDSTKRREAFFLDYARAIRKSATMPLMVTGGFRSARAMQSAVVDDRIDAVGLARPLCVEPDLCKRLLRDADAVAPTPEHSLSLGKGVAGPGSRIRLVRSLNVQAIAAWFYRQIVLLGDGAEPDLSLTAARALREHAANEWRLSRARVAARRAAAYT